MKRPIVAAIAALAVLIVSGGPSATPAAATPATGATPTPAPASAPDSVTATSPLLFRGVDVSADRIAFSLAGRLWLVSRDGGAATPLTDGPDDDDLPCFSPDGREVAFSRTGAGGNVDVWVVPVAGGEPRRVTFHPKMDLIRDWSPDGSRLLFTSERDGDGAFRLYTIPATGGPPEPEALPNGYQGVFSPDGKRLAYTPRSLPFELMEWRYYRGGAASPVWIVDRATSRVTARLPRRDENLRTPMWRGDRLYYLTDEGGTFNLAVTDVAARRARVLTAFRGAGIRMAGLGPDAIVFTVDGTIHLWDLASESERIVPVSVRLDAATLAPRREAASSAFESFSLSPDGARAVVGARGDVLVVPVADPSAARNLTASSGAADREPVFSPEGNRVAWFGDEGGEYALRIAAADGSGAVRTVRVEANPTYYRGLRWSPDGARLSFSDARLRLWVVDVARGAARAVDSSRYVAQGIFKSSWSPDGRWLAYAKADGRGLRSIFVFDSRSGTVRPITDGSIHCDDPAFDRNGRYLYFSASADARMDAAGDVGWGLLSSTWYEPNVTRRLCVAVLRRDDASPFLPVIGAPNGAADLRTEAPETRIDFDGIAGRIVPVPAGERNYMEIAPGTSGTFYARALEWPATPGGRAGNPTPLYRIDLARPRDAEKFLEDVDWFDVAARGDRVAYGARGNVSVVALGADGGRDTTLVALDSVRVAVTPREEWAQMLGETWRMIRDYFYDPGHHARDLAALRSRYERYLPGVTRREDLNDLFRRMIGELSVSHVRVGGGDPGPRPRRRPVRDGDLAADFEADGGRLRFSKIYRNGPIAHWSEFAQAPLDQPGLNLRDGEYLLAIDGAPVTDKDNVYALLAGKGGRPTPITVGPRADGEGSRTVTVLPVPGSNTIRRLDWAERNRRIVEKRSGGRLGYVYVPSYGSGLEDFVRGFIAQAGTKEGIIIDQRWNGGGVTPDELVRMLLERPWYGYRYRHGDDFLVPPNRLDGPKVLVTNEWNGSAAETGALMLKLTGGATLVGGTTAGAGIGSALFQEPLIDGGRIDIPNRAAYDPAGEWGIENRGVVPDVEVEETPEAWRAGDDPRLDAAIDTAMKALSRWKREPWKRPAYPKHP